MPKMSRTSSQHRYPAPPTIPVPLAAGSSNMSYYSTRPVSGYYADMTSSAAQAPISVSSYDAYAGSSLGMSHAGTVGGPVGGPVGGHRLPTQHRASSGAWTPQDDATLLQARASGHNWNQIQAMYFPGKTGNACRKRHERLMERKGTDDWDTRKLERLSKEYMSMRKEIWQPLARRCGEKWNVVEQKCMSSGLKNMQSYGRQYARRQRLESGQPLTGYEDDNGTGIDLDGVEDMAEDTYSSPETTTSSTGGASNGGSSTTSQPSYRTAMQNTPSYQGYNFAQQHSYTSSALSHGTTGYGQHNTSQGSSPYTGHGNRLPSVGDMGIDAIINRDRSGPVGV